MNLLLLYYPLYPKKKSGLLPNWLITDNIALGINFQTSKGIIIRDTQQLQLLKHEFIREKVLARKMLFRSDLDSYVKDVNTMMSEGYVTHNYYIEYSPCLLHLIPANILEQQIILDTVERNHYLFLFLNVPDIWKTKTWYIFSVFQV